MPKSYYALITPLFSDARPDQGLPGEQPGIDNSLPPFPAHPIVIPPDGLAPGVPTHPIYIPPIPDNSLPPSVTPPIYIPPDAIAPGVPTQPIFIPPTPDNTLPGQPPRPDNTLPGQPPKPDQGLPGSQPGVDNSLPPIQFPPLPDIPEDAVGVVLVKMRGQEAEWMYVTEDDELKPIDGDVVQPTGRGGKRR